MSCLPTFAISSHLPGVNIEIGQPISHRIDAMLSGTEAQIAIKLFGDDLAKLYNIGNRIKHLIFGCARCC